MHILSLPKELITNILSRCTIADIPYLELVSTFIRCITKSSSLLRSFILANGAMHDQEVIDAIPVERKYAWYCRLMHRAWSAPLSRCYSFDIKGISVWSTYAASRRLGVRFADSYSPPPTEGLLVQTEVRLPPVGVRSGPDAYVGLHLQRDGRLLVIYKDASRRQEHFLIICAL